MHLVFYHNHDHDLDDHNDHDDDHDDIYNDSVLVDAGMLSRHSGESHRVTLHKVFSTRHFVTLSDGEDHKVIIK